MWPVCFRRLDNFVMCEGMMDDDLKDQLSLFGQQEEPPRSAPPKVAPVGAPPKSTSKGAKGSVTTRQPGSAVPVVKAAKTGKVARARVASKAPAKTYAAGLVPAGDVRLTINIRQDLHLRLKIAAAHGRTTIGEIIEELVEQYVGGGGRGPLN